MTNKEYKNRGSFIYGFLEEKYVRRMSHKPGETVEDSKGTLYTVGEKGNLIRVGTKENKK